MLEMRSVAKVFRTEQVETHALRSLDLHVREGEFVAVTGPSGSGKTTFLNIAGLLETFTSGNGQPFPGEISAVSPEVVAGEVNARIRFTDKQPQGLRQSQRMQSRIVLDTRRNVIKVERGPFVEQGNGQAYVMDGDTAIRRPVRLGVSSLGEVEILSGLRPGDRVVVSGADLFGDAESVSIN